MVEVGFNELSISLRANSRSHAASVFNTFFKLIDGITELKIAPVRIRTSVEITTTSISENFYSIKDWLRTLEHETRQRYLGYIAQQPLIADNPYFKHNDQDVVGFGYAFVNDLVAVSFSTNDVWINDEYILSREYLPDGDSDVVIDEVTVKHCIKNGASLNHSNWIQQEYNRKQVAASKELRDFDSFWANRLILFPWLEFAEEINVQGKEYATGNAQNFKKAMRYLMQLNQHLISVNQRQDEFGAIPGDVSNDSEATMNEYSGERTFTSENGITRIFSLHAKLGDLRIYLFPLPETNKYIVGYIGKHLPTKNFN